MPIKLQPPSGILYTWAQGLGSGPDVPHAANASGRKTEGSGVGFITEPPVSARAVASSENGNVKNLSFRVRLVGQEVVWETLLVGQTLFIEIPADILPDGSKESFVTLLEYAEDVLACSHVIVCFKKNRNDRATLVKTFMFLGFVPLAPGSHRLAVSSDLIYLAYTVDPDDSEDDGSSDCDSD